MNKIIFFFMFLLNSCCFSAITYESGFVFDRSDKEKPRNSEHVKYLHIPSKSLETTIYLPDNYEIYFLEGYRNKLVSFIISPYIPLPPVIPTFFFDIQDTKYKKCNKKSRTSTLIVKHKYRIPKEYNFKENIYLRDGKGLKIFPIEYSTNKSKLNDDYSITRVVFDINCKDLNDKKLIMKYFYDNDYFESDYLKFKRRTNLDFVVIF